MSESKRKTRAEKWRSIVRDDNMGRKGNVVATVIIIALLLVSSAILIQREIYPSTTSFLPRIMGDFSRIVYENPIDVVEAYAQNGYQQGVDGVWFCGDYASPPNLTKIYGDFPDFAEALLAGGIATLGEEFPEYNVTVTRPLFHLVGPPDMPELLNERVTVEVQNFSVTVVDGDRLITTNYDQVSDYDLRFWFMYKVMRGWIGCDNGGIYEVIDSVMETRECAFFKDMCFAACETRGECQQIMYSCDLYPEPCNDCWAMKNPAGAKSYLDEVCSPEAETDELQDFTLNDRQELITSHGIKLDDLYTIGDGIAQSLSRAFANDTYCPAVQEVFEDATGPSGITCTAEIINIEDITNVFRSSYAYHPTGCVFQVDGTCQIQPISIMNTLQCMGESFCPPNSILDNPEAIPQILADSSGVVSPSEGCELVEVSDGQGGTYPVWQCENGEVIGGEVCLNTSTGIQCAAGAGLIECTYIPTQFNNANQGDTGHDPDANVGLTCNPKPLEADEGVPDLASNTLRAGDPKYKCLVPDSEWYKRGKSASHWWFGTNGWLDRRSTMDVKVTCTDPGTLGVQPLETQIRMRIHFRHGCDSDQSTMRGWAPPMCAVPGVGSYEDCMESCTPSACEQSSCEPDGAGGYMCVKEPATPGSACINNDDPCFKATCQDDGTGTLTCQSSGDRKPTITYCGDQGDNAGCMRCSGPDDDPCQPIPAESLQVCGTTSAACKQKVCDGTGQCILANNPGGSCDGGECAIGECAGCDVHSGSCVCNVQPPANPQAMCSGSSYLASDGTSCFIYTPNELCVEQGNEWNCVNQDPNPPSPTSGAVCCPPGEEGEICQAGQICCDWGGNNFQCNTPVSGACPTGSEPT